MAIYQAVVTVILAALLLNTLNNLRLLRRPAGTAAALEGPLVSILVPARNEARQIVRCVESLARQDYPRCEVLVLDDHSTDETAALVEKLARRYPQVTLLRGKPLPPNWHGKAFACAQLALAAHGEWLLFVDADTVHAPHCVSAALRMAQERRADLLTMVPRLIAGTWGEAVLEPTIPLTFVSFLPLGLVSARRWPIIAGALGQFLLFRREMYWRIGGHEAVRTDIVEDMQLSRLVKRAGGRLLWIDGTELMGVRMYHGLREAWYGLAKSAFAAIDYSVPALLPGLLACAAVLLGPYVFLLAALLGHPGGAVAVWLPLAQLALLWTAYGLLLHRFHLSLSLVLWHPVTILAIMAFTLHSAYLTTFAGGVQWKGRTYQFAPHRPRAAEMAIVRLLIVVLLVFVGWCWHAGAPVLAALLTMAAWTCIVIEQTRLRDRQTRLSVTADGAWYLAGLVYLNLSDQLSLGLVLSSLLVVGISVRVFSWHMAALLGSLPLGGAVVLGVGMYAPALEALLLAWIAVLVFTVRQPVTQVIAVWLRRLRSL